MDYPVVGYHNWKETHYLTEARNFARDGFFKYGFFIPAKDYPSLRGDSSGAHADTFPVISVSVALGFMFFGQELWVARLISILFNLGFVAGMYFLGRELFGREDFGLLAAFMSAILPLFVFFSHNVQLINPGIFFMVLSSVFYVRWRSSFSSREIILCSVFLMFATVTKYSFGVILVPMVLLFPYKRFWRVGGWRVRRAVGVAFLIFLLVPVWHVYANYLIPASYRLEKQAGLSQIQPMDVFHLDWFLIWSFISENYTLFGFYVSLFGLLFMLLFFYRGRGFGEGFVLAYVLSILPFSVLMSSKLSGHSYHQYPIAPVVVLLISYFIIRVGDYSKELRIEGKRIQHINVLVVVAIALLFSLLCYEGASRQFDTQFPGLDVAGEYIKEHSQPDERILFTVGQTYGILWHADRKGYPMRVPPPEDFEYAEENNLNLRWIFIYEWGFDLLKHEREWSYIKDRFSLKHVAFKQTKDGLHPIYFLMEKGGSFDETALNDIVENFSYNLVEYEYTKGNYEILSATIGA